MLLGHAPLLAELGAGDVIIHCAPETTSDADKCGPEGESRYNVSWGFVEVLPSRVTILASDALKPEEIDIQRARQQLDRGQKMWNEAGESEEAYDDVSASSPKPKPKSLRPLKSPSRTKPVSLDTLQQKCPAQGAGLFCICDL